MNESRETEGDQRLDFPGAVLTVAGLALLTFGFLRMPSLGFDNPQVYGTIAGVGLLLLSFVKQTYGAGEYRTTFFPGIVGLGLGMSFTVASLTATVMGSVSDHLSGTASGVNNAVTRIAGVFANAIFGALAVLFSPGQYSGKSVCYR